MTPRFVPGLELARDFYGAVVGPLLAEEFPGLEHAAALIGPGSDVNGYDSERSTDHDWGPRLQVFLSDASSGSTGDRVTAMLAGRLPGEFRGYPVRFPVTREPDGVARHRVEVAGLGGWLTGLLGFDPRGAVTLGDWLATPTQRLAELTAGEVFHDGPGELTRARDNTAWYPGDIWRYVLACQWRRVDQEEPFPGRCAEAGDDLGSRVVTARLARDLMRLCLLMHRQYPPYGKWLGTAFARLPGGAPLGAALTAAISAGRYQARERHLTGAMEAIAAQHNRLGLTPPLDTRPRRFFDRPYLVLGAGRFTAALRETITDPRVRDLPLTGAVDQFTDSADAAGDPGFLRACVDRAHLAEHH
ncbi:MAG TPA: DUF4037 domain-containing protein [Trebonia sp.]|nr:DUF4037 domain-containing protein [Trebonia sp.]